MLLPVAAHIDQLGVQRVLMGWFSSEDFARYARSILEPILELDAEHELLRNPGGVPGRQLLEHRCCPSASRASQYRGPTAFAVLSRFWA